MQYNAGQLLFAPSDLIRFMESPYCSWMDRYHLEKPGALTPDAESEDMKLIAATGDKHEKNFLAELKKQGSVHEISRGASALEDTLAAIRAGHSTIFQACLQKGRFKGYADFLQLCGQGPAGQPVYEVWDTKLARKTKPYYLVQLCCYGEMLADIQGVLPVKMRVVLGSGDMPEYATSDFFYYYLELKAAFLALMDGFDPESPPVPEPRADHGRWASHAEHWLTERDHLVQVANINTSQIKKLTQAGVTTVAELAVLGTKKVPRLPADLQARLVQQASLQVETRELRRKAEPGTVVKPAYRILPPSPQEPHRGLAALPPLSGMDVFFDMEGFPLAERGLEYLFGATVQEANDKLGFHDWWAHDEVEEKKAFEGFIDWAYARWLADPLMHIYHYAAYEVTAMRKLMGKHGTREEEVDDLLRHEVFVDLYQVVRQGLRVGESSYSIKTIERLYRGKREGEVSNAGQSMVYYANWIESGEARDWHQSPILRKIRDYNEDDCVSTVQLCSWLRERQQQAGINYAPRPKKMSVSKEPDPEILVKLEEHRLLLTALEKKVSETKDEELKRLHLLFSHLLEFHRRERKPFWWRWFDRLASEPEVLKEDLDCLGDATLLPDLTQQVKQSKVFTYAFDPNQDTKISDGDKVNATANPDATFEVVAVDDEKGLIELKIGDGSIAKSFPDGLPEQTSFIPAKSINDQSLRSAVQAVIRDWVAQGNIPPCLDSFLRRTRPRIKGDPKRGPLQQEGEDIGQAAVRCALQLDRSALCLQGPPGTGKTTTAAAMILALVKAGKSVGISSNSHKAIENLLLACARQTPKFKALKVGGSAEIATNCTQITHTVQTRDAAGLFQSGVIGGTAWLFSREEWAGRLDYLFVDEAGQVSLANLVAMSRATANLVVLGDQMQLEQPTQGSHPGESGESILNYYLQKHATIPPELGLFLPITYRLHPEICCYISEMIYEDRLQPASANVKRSLKGKRTGEQLGLPEAGLRFVPIEHENNVQASDEEADAIARIITDLQGRTVHGADGKAEGPFGPKNLLVVAPYNMQVRKLRERLPGHRVASVDKFQGQEADVVIVSMCSSFGEYGSRGLEFILDENRLNVAISRARTLAIVVGDPRIARASTGTIPGMHRLNLYCRLTQGPKLALR